MGNTLDERVQMLVAEIGGRSRFIDHVWPGSKTRVRRSNEAKLSKWIGDKSGMSVAEAEHVARKFGRRVSWLLFGELPERAGLTREKGELAADLAAEMRSRVAAATGDPPLLIAIDETDLLTHLERLAVEDYRANKAHWHRTHGAAQLLTAAARGTKDAALRKRIAAFLMDPQPGFEPAKRLPIAFGRLPAKPQTEREMLDAMMQWVKATAPTTKLDERPKSKTRSTTRSTTKGGRRERKA